MTGVLIKGGDWTHRETRSMCAQRDDHTKRQLEGYLQVKEKKASEKTSSTNRILDFQPPELKNINFYYLSHPLCGLDYRSPNKLI